jgi:tartrate dehydratase beta subunit/fumarate hydratase class I family protein
MDGDSWDYISIGPNTTREQDEKTDTILKRKGLTVGFKASLEFRTMISSHTDTFARGPTTAAALVEAGTK